MTLGDILTAAKKLGTKAETSLGSLLSSAEKKVASGAKTAGDLFNAASSPVNGHAATTIPGIAANTIAGIPKAAAGVAKDIAHGAAQFAYSAGEAIPELPLEAFHLVTGKGPEIKPYEAQPIPGLGFLGPVESYQNKARKAVASGESPVAAILKGGASAVTDEPTGVALKPLALAGHALAPILSGFIKGGGGKALEDSLEALVKAVNPDEVKTILTGAGVSKAQAGKLAPDLAQATTPDAVRAVLGLPFEGEAKAAAPKGEVLYHGTNADFTEFNPAQNQEDFGTWFSPDKKEVTSAGYKNLHTRSLNPDTKLISESDLNDWMDGGFHADLPFPQELQGDGYRGIRYDNGTVQLWHPNEDTVPVKTLAESAPKSFELPANPEQQAVFNKAAKWITDWVAGKKVKDPDADVEAYLSQFKPKKPVTVMRGGVPANAPKGLTSYTYDGRTAKGFGIESGIDDAEVVSEKLHPDQILADLTQLPEEVKDAMLATIKNKKEREEVSMYLDSEGEVIARPKTAAPVEESAPVSRETPESVGTMRSVGDLLKGGDGKVPPSVPRETTGPIPSGDPERRFITRTKAMAPEAQAMLDGKYKARDTKELIATADNLIASAPERAERLAIEGTDDNAVAVASRLIDTYINDAKAATGPAKDTLYEKAAEIANAAAKTLTEHGRAVQAASILGKLTPEGMVRYAARQIQKYNEQAGERTVKNLLGLQKKIPELTGEQAQGISDAMEKIQAMTDPEEKAKAFNDLSQQVRKLIPSTLYAKVIGLWKAGLLTGLKTSGLNIASNFSHAVAETAKDVPAALVDRVASLFTGKRTLAATVRGVPSGTAEGIQKGWRFFRTGYDERDALEGLDFKQVNFGNGPLAKAAQAYEQTIFRTLGAEDQPFYYGAKARSLYSQAIAEAKNLGLKGAALGQKVNELVSNPTDDMLKYAVMDAQTAVFQNKTALGTAARAIQNLPGGEVLLPFGKTPAAVATQLINYTPVGIVKTVIENIGKGRFDQRLFAQGIGRGLTGTGVLAIGGALAAAGLITGAYPTSEKEQKQWQLEGKQANSIKIGDKWRGVGVLGPLGMVLSVGAALHNGIQDTGSFIGGLGEAAAAGGNALTQQSFLYGINQAINALNDPARYGASFINNTIGSIIPTIVADIARATDTNERQTNTATQRLVSRIPGLRELLQPQVDTLGNKIKTAPFLTVMADPTRPYEPTQAPNDPVVKELRRLDDAGYNVTPTMLGTKQGFKTLTGPENTKLWINAGTAAKKAISDITQDSVYPSLDDEQKSKLVAKVVDDAETQARAQVVVDATKGLAGKALDDKIAEMVADKLVTKTVYKWYAALGGIGNYPIAP